MAFLRKLLNQTQKIDTTPLLAVVPVEEKLDEEKLDEEKLEEENWLVINVTPEQRFMERVNYLEDIVEMGRSQSCPKNLCVFAMFLICIGAVTASIMHYKYSKKTFNTHLDIFAKTHSTLNNKHCSEEYKPYYDWIKFYGFSLLDNFEFEERHFTGYGEYGSSLNATYLIGPNIKDIACYNTFYDIANGPGMFMFYNFVTIGLGSTLPLLILMFLSCCMVMPCYQEPAFDTRNYREDIAILCNEYQIDSKLPPDKLSKKFQVLLDEFQLRRNFMLDFGKSLSAHGLFRQSRLMQIVCEYADIPDPTKPLLKSLSFS